MPGDDNLIVGIGLGQLSASAVSCSRTLADLVDPAIEAVRLAFRIGALVGANSPYPPALSSAGERWSMKVAGAAEDIKSELQAIQNQQVCFNGFFVLQVRCRSRQNPVDGLGEPFRRSYSDSWEAQRYDVKSFHCQVS